MAKGLSCGLNWDSNEYDGQVYLIEKFESKKHTTGIDVI